MNHLAFKQFLADHDLSVRKFAEYCRSTYISKSTIHRLANPDGHIQPRFLQRITPSLISHCQQWLEENGRPAEEINRVLTQVFEEDYQPMIAERYKLDPEHLDFFGLDRDPFALEADPRSADEAYSNKELDRIVRRVEEAVKFQGFLCITGPVGAGKTQLKNRITSRLLRPESKTQLLWPRFAEMGKLNAGGIVHYILEEFGQRGRIRLALAQRQLEKHLEQLNENGRRIALCFDEGHRLAPATLSALKNFYELGTGGYEKYLGLIIFAQPRIKTTLEGVDFREIAERVEQIEMPSLSKYAGDYLGHRLALAGGHLDLFAPGAIAHIASQATTPLAIGNLANKGLIAAYKKGDSKVIARHLEKDTEPTVRKLTKVAGGAV